MSHWTEEQLLKLGHRLTDAELQALGEEYLSISDHTQREIFYAKTVFLHLRDHFKTLPAADPMIEVLLLPISSQHIPVLVAARWKPKIVYAIYSSVSARHQSFIEDEIKALGLGIDIQGKPVENIEFEPTRLYQAIKDALRLYIKPGQLNPQVAVDITGGTSVMSVG
ncbi:MAG TPA: hypothetical protein VKY74_02390, partial [Chloroflexia bacterium]|nr:hypothetical protein [Chloroflexia bacterium]